jgi:hypothetical protein
MNYNVNTAQNIPWLLRGAYLAMYRSTNAHLARSGVTADQYVLLYVLAEGNALTQRDLARRSFSDPNTIRPMLKSLEGRGLLIRQQHPNDGRANCQVNGQRLEDAEEIDRGKRAGPREIGSRIPAGRYTYLVRLPVPHNRGNGFAHTQWDRH